MKNLVIGMGEALWDVLPEGKKLGGAPANFAYHVSQFGLSSCIISAIGNDRLGAEITDTLKSKQIQHNLSIVPYPTGTVEVEIDAAGIPQYDIKENVAWDNIPFTPELARLALDTKVFCFGSLAQRNTASRQTILRFLDAIPTVNKPIIVFDINLRQNFYSKELLSESINRCNILKINDEELDIVCRMFSIEGIDIQDKCRVIIDRFKLHTLILTCGTKGSYVVAPGEVSFQPTPKVEVVDTVGAGDSFTAAFVAGLLKGKSVVESHKQAVETSAFVCTCSGAMPSLPTSITGK